MPNYTVVHQHRIYIVHLISITGLQVATVQSCSSTEITLEVATVQRSPLKSDDKNVEQSPRISEIRPQDNEDFCQQNTEYRTEELLCYKLIIARLLNVSNCGCVVAILQYKSFTISNANITRHGVWLFTGTYMEFPICDLDIDDWIEVTPSQVVDAVLCLAVIIRLYPKFSV